MVNHAATEEAVVKETITVQNNTKKEKTNWITGGFYAMGEVGCQLSWYMINTYLTIFYTDIVGLSASAISLIFLVARVWDAINDPMMGAICDKTKTRFGKFRPYIMFSPIFLAIFNILTFTVFPLQGVMKVLVCMICYIGAGMAYTALCIPYQGLVNFIARDSQVRMDYASCRGIGSGAISMVLSAIAMPLILFFGHSENPTATGYFMTTVVFSLALIPCCLLCAWRCKEIAVPVEENVKPTPIKEALPYVFKNKNIMITVFSTFSGAMGCMARMSMLTYYVIYVIGNPMMIAPIFTTMTICQLIGNTTLPWGTKTFTKKGYMLITTFTQVAALVLLFLVPVNNMAFIIGVSAIIGLTMANGNIAPGMMCDSIEYGDWKYGVREVGLTFSLVSFSVKLATAVTGVVTVSLLAAIGYVPNAEQTEAVKVGINALVNLFPAAVIALSGISVLFYDLTPKKMEKIYADLDARKNK
ncbi:MFS transporter [Butyrivibrio sp. AE3004]|uniref:MFS transporter n=1 Tax=Butyrivibrio sp. AE3004 TaxID=1506994 RepID=UPI0009DC9603|nr:glycoside-pentoside-hexuronide (GPH):cation symporter [Butyrivibrio sp. AE3004]